MKPEMTVTSDEWRVTRLGARTVCPVTRHPSPVTRTGFTIMEMLVAMAILSLIVLALMAVFNSTQQAFRASLTQTDLLESGRNAMGLITGDLQQMTPAYSSINTNIPYWYDPVTDPDNTNNNVNFYANVNVTNQLLIQSLPGTDAQRTNILENFFILSRQNVNGSPSWVGTGYIVDPLSSPTNSLYRFSMTVSTLWGAPAFLYNTFASNAFTATFTNTATWSHLMDGVVDLTVRPYDPNGLEMTNTYEYNYNGTTNDFTNQNTWFFPPAFQPVGLKVHGCYLFSNTVPASVEVEMGVLENPTLQHVEGLPDYTAQTNYLASHAGQVHLFRQRVWIRNVDPTAYQ